MKEKWLTESWQKPPAKLRALGGVRRVSSLNAPEATLGGKWIEGEHKPLSRVGSACARAEPWNLSPSNSEMAHPAGFEPATCRLEVGRAIHCATGVEELVASPGVTETPARAIGEITGEIVARLKLLFELDVATAARN